MDAIEILSQVILAAFAIYLTFKFLQALRLVPNQYAHIV